jgi:hypothetical protein
MPQLTASQQKRARAILASGNVTTTGVAQDKFGVIPTGDPRAPYEAKESTIYYTGPEKQPSVTYKDPATGQTYTDYTKPIGPAASGLPDYVPGVAFGFRNFPQRGKETLGGYYLVTPKGGPNAGQSYILPHSDKGPGAGTGEKLDYNAPASMMVYGPKHWKSPPGGSHVQYIGKDLPEDMGIGAVPPGAESRFNLSQSHSEFIKERRLLAQGPGFRGGREVAQEIETIRTEDVARASGGVTMAQLSPGFRGGRAVAAEEAEAAGMASEYRPGRELDAATPTVNGKGKLDVDVNAPRGVVVKAEGEGLFNKTETTRQLEPMAEE